MIALPEIKVDDLRLFADWIELIVLSSEAGATSQADIADVVHDAGLLGTEHADFFPEDDEFQDPNADSDDETAQVFAEEIWGELTHRSGLIGNAYPFEIDGDLIRRSHDEWRDTPSYSFMCLISNLIRFPFELELEHVDADPTFRQLFEKVVQAAKHGLLGGTGVRFGTPKEPGWPTPIAERIAQMGSDLQLTVEKLDGKVESPDNDLSLDVATRFSFLDDGPASAIFVTQCATGRNWKTKQGEPNLGMFDDILNWQAVLVRTVAVPFWFARSDEYARLFRWFGKVVILDRPRLLMGDPDLHLDEYVLEPLVRWCDAQLERLPRLELSTS